MKSGDYVVFLNRGMLSELGKSRKNIWKVADIDPHIGTSKLQSIIDENSYFSTSTSNTTTVEYLKNRNLFKREYFKAEAYYKYKRNITESPIDFNNEILESLFDKPKINNNVENVKMRNNIVKRTMNSNVDAAKVAAKIATGRTVNAVTMDKVKGQLPMLMKGYADTPLGAVVLANIVDAGVKQFAPDNTKFAYVSDAMMQAAMVDFLAEFDFEKMFTEILSTVNVEEITKEV